LTWLVCSSLGIEARYRPLHGAHVALDWFIVCWPLPPVMGSPHRRVLSASLTAQGWSGPPHFVSLSDPARRACTRGLSLVHIPSVAHMPWVRPPAASPQGTAGRLLHTCSISGLFIPFTDVPVYVLPVYASPGTLPYTTQDSVPDCWLCFVRAAISDGWTVYACKAQPPQTRTGAMHADGSSDSAAATPPPSPGVPWSGFVNSTSLPCLPPADALPDGACLPWVPWASVSHLPRDYTPRRLPPCPARVASRVARVPRPCLFLRVRGVPLGLVVWSKRPDYARAWGHPVPHSGSMTRSHVALLRSRTTPMSACPALRPRWCPQYSPSRIPDCCLPATGNRRLSPRYPWKISCCPRLYAFRDSITRPASSFYPAPHAHCWVCTWMSLLTCWLGFGQVGLEPQLLTHWVTTTSFMGLRPIPRFRACLGATSAGFGGGSALALATPPRSQGARRSPVHLQRPAWVPSPSSRLSTPPLLGTTLRRPPAARATERQVSAAPRSRSEARAEAGRRRLHTLVRAWSLPLRRLYAWCFAISSRMAGTSAWGTSITVCVDSSIAASSSATASSSVCSS